MLVSSIYLYNELIKNINSLSIKMKNKTLLFWTKLVIYCFNYGYNENNLLYLCMILDSYYGIFEPEIINAIIDIILKYTLMFTIYDYDINHNMVDNLISHLCKINYINYKFMFFIHFRNDKMCYLTRVINTESNIIYEYFNISEKVFINIIKKYKRSNNILQIVFLNFPDKNTNIDINKKHIKQILFNFHLCNAQILNCMNEHSYIKNKYDLIKS